MNRDTRNVDEEWSPYRAEGENAHRRGLWQRLLDCLAEPNVDYNYDGFADQDRAEAAVAALRGAGIPAELALTDTGPVILVKGRFHRRAEPIITPFEGQK